MTFVGRRDELAVLAGVIAAQGARIAVISAAPGMGKTSLVTAATAELGPTTVVRATAERDDGDAPWSTVTALLGNGLLALAELHGVALGNDLRWVTGFGGGATGGDPDRAAFDFATLATELARRCPLVLVIDDAQWVDVRSSGAFGFAARGGGCWLVARRLGAPTGFLPGGEVTAVALAPLTPGELDLLVRQLTGERWNPVQLNRLAELSGGSPMHATQLVTRYPDPALLDQPVDGLDALLDRRVAALAESERDVLAALALMRRPDLRHLFAALTDSVQIEEALAAGERAGVVRLQGGRLVFEHALTRDAVAARVTDERALALHRLLADTALTDDDRAWHLGRATSRPDALVADVLEAAGSRAVTRGAPAEALALFERAMQLTPPECRPDAVRRAALAGIAANAAGNWQLAERLLEDVAGHPLPRSIGRHARAAFVDASLQLGGPKAGIGALAVVMPAADGAGEAAELLDMRTRMAMHQDWELARTSAEEAVDLALGDGDPERILHARLMLDLTRCALGEHIVLDGYRAAFAAHPERFTERSPFPPALVAFAELMLFHDQADIVDAWTDAVLADAQRAGAMSRTEFARVTARSMAERRGDWATAVSLASTLFGEPIGSAADVERHHDVNLIQLAADTGRHTGLHAAAERAVAAVADGGPYQRLKGCFVAGHTLLVLGDLERAAECFRLAAAAADEWRYTDMRAGNYHASYTEVLVRIGLLDEADAVATAAEAIAASSRWPFCELEALRCRAYVLLGQGRAEEAVALLTAAAPEWATVGRPFEVARGFLLLAGGCRRSRRPAQARAALDRAESMFAELGAHAWLERVAAERRLLGRHARVPAEPDGLTAVETRVAVLIRSGCSAPTVATELAMSLRSVQAHLTRIYRKLGVRRRSELLALDDSALGGVAGNPDT